MKCIIKFLSTSLSQKQRSWMVKVQNNQKCPWETWICLRTLEKNIPQRVLLIMSKIKNQQKSKPRESSPAVRHPKASKPQSGPASLKASQNQVLEPHLTSPKSSGREKKNWKTIENRVFRFFRWGFGGCHSI